MSFADDVDPQVDVRDNVLPPPTEPMQVARAFVATNHTGP